MATEIGKRLRWVQLAEQGKSCAQVCLQCGISRPTLRKWVARYRAAGPDGLQSQSRRPHRSPARKVSEQERAWIAEFRQRGLGSRRIQSELKRNYDLELSRPTLEKVFRSLEPRPRLARKMKRKHLNRYAKEIPGERVQMDTCKIAPGLYQYTAIDDCTRIRVLALYKRRSAANSLLFLEKVVEEFPFPIQRIQTDRGREFFAYAFQEKLMEYGIKFRPLKPASPHLNGKVERSQRTDLEEFYATVDLRAEDLAERLDDWQVHYNEFRVHGSLDGRTPWQVWYERARLTPLCEEVEALYDECIERIRHPDYRIDLQLGTNQQQLGRKHL
ncbi:MAG TPA: IS481 family transposase [Bryobacteraceae bacterium]|nr:IS481 family transposase [Bryobacteraceae bacterium]